MLERLSPLTQLTRRLASNETTPSHIAEACASRANQNESHNTYLYFNRQESLAQTDRLEKTHPNPGAPASLFGIPISLKDCFDLAGTVTTCGSAFYAQHNPPACEDSAVATRLRTVGALIPGKTHMQSLAYGITGQNRDYGNCLQPRNASLLTGGSSSGAAASVQEGSALAAIGTDTGGSIRVPAALCGLAGYRASHALAYESEPDAPNGLWTGAAHLAPSFDTIGLLARDPRDLAPIAQALFGLLPTVAQPQARIGYVGASFLAECNADNLESFDRWRAITASAGASLELFDTASWLIAPDIFAPIQAHEAARLHRGHYDEFEPAIAQRLHWGASLSLADLDPLHQRLDEFRAHMATLFDRFDFLLLPCAPINQLRAAQDHSSIRQKFLPYTTPFSLAGLPVAALPGEIIGAPLGTGVQLAAAQGNDAILLDYVATLTQHIIQQAT